ncbi:MAG TPA: HAMP domain-containing sensor histidine kinase [Blastocatellia bacterium]|nr:HAMP domain-containing sensor histidine kinase [Blastocatellia bacterium]
MRIGTAKDITIERAVSNEDGHLPRLQGLINDLSNLMAVPVIWRDRELPKIIGVMLEVLLGSLPLEFVYIRLKNPADGPLLEMIRVTEPGQLTCQPSEIGRAFDRWLTRDILVAPQVMPNPVGEGKVPVVRFRIGLGEELGVIIAGSRQAGFPDETEVLLLQAGAHQATMVIQEAQLLSERKQLIDQLCRFEAEQRARLRAEADNCAKDESLATVAHELRAPLNVILGWTSLLRTGKMGAAEVSQALEIVERHARSQNQILNDLLDISGIITGNLRLDCNPVEIASVVEAGVEALRPTAESRGIHLQSLLGLKAGRVIGDPVRLQQIIYNLLSNAIKFTPRDGRIQIRLERVNSHVEIVVSDTGAGINGDFLPYVFDRYRRDDRPHIRKLEGVGLGLAIVLRLVRLHQGTIHAYSDGEGKGATFIVKLPLSDL